MNDGNVRGKDRLDQTFLDLDPLVKDFAQVCNIDLTIGTNPPEYDIFNLFTAFLITNHPSVGQAIKTIRQKLGVTKPALFRTEQDEEATCSNCSLDDLREPLKKSLNKQVDDFFVGAGKNLMPDDWHDEIATFILTGVLPLPSVTSCPFELHQKIDEQLFPKIKNFPVLVFKKRVREQELDQVINYLKDMEYGLVRLTAHLPSPPVKRRDINLTKLVAGLWVIKRDLFTDKEFKKRINQKYRQYLKKNGFEYDTENQKKLKADAIMYLRKLYPLPGDKT